MVLLYCIQQWRFRLRSKFRQQLEIVPCQPSSMMISSSVIAKYVHLPVCVYTCVQYVCVCLYVHVSMFVCVMCTYHIPLNKNPPQINTYLECKAGSFDRYNCSVRIQGNMVCMCLLYVGMRTYVCMHVL